MMNANEARNKTNELLKADEDKKMEVLQAWIEETCGKAIEEAIEARKFETVVQVPDEYNISAVARELRNKHYTAEICWSGSIDKITISWRKS